MRQDSFKNRYLIKVGSSVLIAVFNIIAQLALPRAFSVEEYGFYTYNLNIFTSIVVMANLSTSNALVSKYSKRNNELGIVYFYLKYFSLAALLLNLAIIVLYSTKILQETFAGQTLIIVLLGLETAVFNKLLADCVSVFDASAISRFPALLQIILKAIISIAIILGYFLGKLNLLSFYLIQLCITGSIIFIMLAAFIKNQKQRFPQTLDYGIKYYIKEYYVFCKPLFFSSLISQFAVIVMNWGLMKWSGAKEQAMFGAAWQLNTLVSYVFSPYAELLKREFALNYDKDAEMKKLYINSLKLIIWITAYFAMFIGFCADWILPVVYGDKYQGAGLATLLIMFYTVYQGWGQMNGSFMIATERTKMSAILSIINQMLTLLCVFIFQMPNFLFPKGLGAIGIACTYMISCFISVSINTLCVSKELHLSKAKTWLIHIMPVAFCGGLSYALYYIGSFICPIDGILANSLKIVISGILYTLGLAALLLCRPQLIGISKDGIRQIFKGKISKKG